VTEGHLGSELHYPIDAKDPYHFRDRDLSLEPVAGTGPRTKTVRDFGARGGAPQLESILSSQQQKTRNASTREAFLVL
jgi:hypothetical protein